MLNKLIKYLSTDKEFTPYDKAPTNNKKILYGTVKYTKAVGTHKKGSDASVSTILGEIDPAISFVDFSELIDNITDDEYEYLMDKCYVDPDEVKIKLLDAEKFALTDSEFNALFGPYIHIAYTPDRKIQFFYKRVENGRCIGLVHLSSSRDTFFDVNELQEQLIIDRRINDFENHIDYIYNNNKGFRDAILSFYEDYEDTNIVMTKMKFFETILKNTDFKPAEFPKLLSNDASDVAFANINLDEIKNTIGPTNIIDNWLTSRFRPDQIELLKQVIAKVLISGAPDIRGVYIYDPDGKHGKSTLLDALQYGFEKLNISCCNMTTDGADKHQFVQYFGKLVCFNADVKNPNFVQTGLFHQVTSNDLVTIDGKGQQPFAAHIKVTPFLAGNIMIELDTSKDHMMRRIVMLEMQPVASDYIKTQMHLVNGKMVWNNAADFANQFKEQMPNFICKCYRDTLKYDLAQNEIIPSEDIKTDMIECDTTSDVIEKAVDMFIKDLLDVTGNFGDEVSFADICYYFQNGYKTKEVVGALQIDKIIDHTFKGDAKTPWGKNKIKQILVDKVKDKRSVYTLTNEISVKTRPYIDGKQKKMVIIRGLKFKESTILGT